MSDRPKSKCDCQKAVETALRQAAQMLKHEAFGARRLMLDRNATKLGITLARTVMNTDLENAKKVMAMIPKRQPRATQEQGGDK